jgi:hypothetical protein
MGIKMQVITATAKDGKELTIKEFDSDLVQLKEKFDQACLTSPMFSIFGGVITLPNGNKYQVCG